MPAATKASIISGESLAGPKVQTILVRRILGMVVRLGPEMDDGIPKQIGRYEIDRLLGSGAMGFVFLGRDPELDRPVAIKTVRDLRVDDDALATFLERFRNEARAAARLHHPHIVQVYDVGDEEDVGPYLVFEYVAGSTLKQILRAKGALDPLGVVRLAEEIGQALSVAHEQQIIHRDIKPDNLLVTPEGQTKLADFGVARMPNAALTREGQFLGTPCYAAPETLKQGAYGVHSDLFSFAAVIYEAASGTRAFPGQDAVAVAHKVIHDEPPPVRSVAQDSTSIPKRVESVIMRGLSKDPSQRYSSAVEFAGAVADAYEESGLVVPADITRPPSRRHRVGVDGEGGGRSGLAFAAVLLGGLAIGVAVVFAFQKNTSDEAVFVDAGIGEAPDAASVTLTSVEDAAVEVDVGAEDTAPDAVEGDDAGIDAGDEARDFAAMTNHEREEAAKDALDRARAALLDGDPTAAREALEEARRYDAENPDINELEQRLSGPSE